MNKATIKAFIAWLETASPEAIEARRREAETLDVRTAQAKADIRLALRLIDEELLARLDLQKVGDHKA